MDSATDKLGMIANQYTARSEFELYRVLLRELLVEDFSETTSRAYCFRCETNSLWNLIDRVETEVPEVCGEFVLKFRPTSFVAVLSVDKTKTEVCFQGQELLLRGEFNGRDFLVVEFEDKTPNEDLKKYKIKEQDEALRFFRQHFKKS